MFGSCSTKEVIMNNPYMIIDTRYGHHALVNVVELYELGINPHKLPDNIYPIHPDKHQEHLDNGSSLIDEGDLF